MANKSVRMLRNMGRYKAGDIYTNVPEWCRQLIAVGFAEELPEAPPRSAAEEPEKRHRQRRRDVAAE